MKITEHAKRKVTALATACALAATAALGAASPALAAPDAPASATNKVTITKTLEGATTSLPDDAQFIFTFTPTQLTETGAAKREETPAISDATVNIGMQDGKYLIAESADNGVTTTLTNNVEVDLSQINFPHVGVYGWAVAEKTTPAVDGVTMSQATYTLRIYHKNDGSNIITVEKTQDDKGTTDDTKVKPNPDKGTVDPGTDPINPTNPNQYKSGFIFKNVIAAGTITGQNNLKISKTVMGDFGDKTLGFQFHLTLSKPATSTATSVNAYVYQADGQKLDNAIVFTYGAKTDFTLKDGQYLLFEDGMADGTKYVLTEDGAPSYTASAVSVSGGEAEVTADKAADGVSAIVAGNGIQVTNSAQAKAANTAAVTNTFAEVTPTGIAISVLPYAVMVAVPVAAAGAWIVSRRRNGQDA